MPIPLLFIGIAAATGATGLGAGAKAGLDQSRAKKLNQNSNQRIENASMRLEGLRHQCGSALENLGHEKMFILNNSIAGFLNAFSKLKNVDFTESSGLNELKKLNIDKADFESLKEMKNFVSAFATGTLAGATGGALTAFGAYSAAATLASASTGTAISTLSGVATHNATLAFFGGGSLATGGLGMAGGTAVLGGLVAGPVLLIMGITTGAKAGKNLENAKSNAAEADLACEQLEAGCDQCIAIRRRTTMFYSLLARLDAYFSPLVAGMECIINDEGCDYSLFTDESKAIISSAAAVASTLKAVLDTPILSEDGSVTDESKEVLQIGSKRLKALNQNNAGED